MVSYTARRNGGAFCAKACRSATPTRSRCESAVLWKHRRTMVAGYVARMETFAQGMGTARCRADECVGQKWAFGTLSQTPLSYSLFYNWTLVGLSSCKLRISWWLARMDYETYSKACKWYNAGKQCFEKCNANLRNRECTLAENQQCGGRFFLCPLYETNTCKKKVITC